MSNFGYGNYTANGTQNLNSWSPQFELNETNLNINNNNNINQNQFQQVQSVNGIDCDLVDNSIFSQNAHAQSISQDGSLTDQSSPNNNININANTLKVPFPITSQDVDVLNNTIQNEDTELTTQQAIAKRKLQNRAAQRAFRERKEMKLKELEDKLKESESDKENLRRELDLLKKQNIVISTENKLLLQNGNSSSRTLTNASAEQQTNFSFPTKDQYYTSHTPVKSENGQPVSLSDVPSSGGVVHDIQQEGDTDIRLTIPEVWEYLDSKNDPRIEIEQVMKSLKGNEVCHQQGPAYKMSLIEETIAKFYN